VKLMTLEKIVAQCPDLKWKIERQTLYLYWGEYLKGEVSGPESDIGTRKLFLTIFKDETGCEKFKGECTLPEWRDNILTANATSKDKLHWLKGAKFGDALSEKKSYRTNLNVKYLTAIVVEHDSGEIGLDAAADIIRDAGLRGLLYTSPSHKADKPKWRIILPLSYQADKGRHEILVATVNGLFDGLLSPESFTLSQSYYFGSVNHNNDHRAVVVDGQFLDLRTDSLYRHSIFKDGGRVGDNPSEHHSRKQRGNDGPIDDNPFTAFRNGEPVDEDKVEFALNQISPDCPYRETNDDLTSWMHAGAAIASAVKYETGLAMFRKWSAKSEKFDAATIDKKFKDFSEMTDIGIDSLFKFARKANPNWEDEWQALNSPDTADDVKPKHANPFEVFWHGVDYDRAVRPWLINTLIPEQGAGLMSGQWGTAKTFVAIDAAGAVMTGTDFAGRKIDRRGGVLFIAAEGAGEVSIRLDAMVTKLNIANGNKLPFAWIEDTPDLKANASYRQLVDAAVNIGKQIKVKFGVDLVMIIIDTISAAANFKDQNDAAEGQFVMNRLNELGRKTGAVVMAVDHFGKDASTGTRGTSAKEAASDFVLATLADRDLNGTLSKTRLAVRKLRGGKTGEEFPFDLEVVAAGFGQTTCVIEWRAAPVASDMGATSEKAQWPKTLRVLRTSMQAMLAEKGRSITPYGAEGPTVMAVVQADLRVEFMAAYPVDEGGERDQKATKRSAFNRHIKDARDRELIVSREIGGDDMLWFAKENE
jgi:AAA domain/Primase C terminal 2 (PriCT-2)